jgi:predicted dehydrogenase
MSKVRIAVAGAGLIGRRHIELVQASSSCELSAIVDPAPNAGELAAKEGVSLYTTLDALFEQHRPDGVILATPNQLHVEQALKCIEAGVASLLEKPVADSVEEGERLCQVAEAKGAKILVGHHRTHSPIMARAREIIEQGALGKPVALMGSAVFYKPDDYFDIAPWRREPGGGPILINMIHEVHNLRMLCGEITAVQAFSSNATRGFPVEDTVAINLRFANGALGTFLLSDTAGSPKSWEQTSRENKSYASYPDEDCYVVVGTFGSLEIPTMRLKTYGNKEDRSWWKPFQESVVEVDRADPLERQLEHFCAVIRGEAKPLVTVRDALQNLRVTEAIVAAARCGSIVSTEMREITGKTQSHMETVE